MKAVTTILLAVVGAAAFASSVSAGTPVPPIDGPATVETSVPPKPEACIQWETGGPDLPEGQYLEFGYDTTEPGITGSTRWGLFPCKPFAPVEAVTEPAAAPATSTATRVSLPATGLNETLAVTAGVLLVSAGVLLYLWSKQR